VATYSYTARDSRGGQLTGFQEATNESEAVKILQTRGLTITKIGQPSDAHSTGRKKRLRKRIKQEDYLVFTRETATLLEAGIPLLRTLEVIAEQVESAKLRTTVIQMITDIKAGSTFKDAVAHHPKIFPGLWVHLLEAGELSGNLTLVLSQIAEHLETSIGMKKKLVSALAYPAVLICVAVGAIFVFLLKIIPVFDDLFKSMNAQLPFLTQVVINLSHALQKYFVWFIVAVAVASWLFKRWIATPTGRRAMDALLLRLPVFGNLMRDVIVARITVNLATLVRSGVNIIQSVDITSKAAGNALYREALERTKNDLQQGKAMSSSMAESPLFAPIVVHMVMIGEESGKLSDMLGKLADYYEDRVEVFLGRLGVLIEPLILVVIGGVIAFLVIAMFLPILSLSQIVK